MSICRVYLAEVECDACVIVTGEPSWYIWRKIFAAAKFALRRQHFHENARVLFKIRSRTENRCEAVEGELSLFRQTCTTYGKVFSSLACSCVCVCVP